MRPRAELAMSKKKRASTSGDGKASASGEKSATSSTTTVGVAVLCVAVSLGLWTALQSNSSSSDTGGRDYQIESRMWVSKDGEEVLLTSASKAACCDVERRDVNSITMSEWNQRINGKRPLIITGILAIAVRNHRPHLHHLDGQA